MVRYVFADLAAAPAVPVLMDLLWSPEEEYRIRRNAVRAPGSIGTAAMEALPLLQEVRKQLGLEQEVDGAVLRIQGKSPNTWH